MRNFSTKLMWLIFIVIILFLSGPFLIFTFRYALRDWIGLLGIAQ